MAQTMDDMVFQCSNQNSIYVLNASYGAYGDYGTYAATKREINGSWSRAAANPIEATCSSGVLQHKFKTFGSAAATTTTTTTADAAAGSASNYVNPVGTSMSTAMCSPATAALQKLFNCSAGIACQNVTHAATHSNHSSSSNTSSSNINGSSNNNSNHNNSCLSAAGGVTQNGRNRSRSGETLDGPAGVVTSTGAGGGVGGAAAAGGPGQGGLPLMPKKKCTNVKSALIAKKTKFLKYLEEEKWSSHAGAAEDAGAISNEAEPPSGNNLKNQSNSRQAGNGNGNGYGYGSAGGVSVGGRQLNKLTNWSVHNEDNSTATLTNNQQQQQQQQEHQEQLQLQQPGKSSFELYQEAADILGLSCSLCDNCRCLDCQRLL
ncbi:translation initiation factor IF-2 isoform X2 [Drosophila gunungcola]|uniref:translation initiation factor IF-2 isoform X2 n=1 Tax=Drosophila gunungcola TaxID=103775 RepID=UPI0022E93EB1|nr:translation initiation factor IF-2 isoform X2 [Drosophila gunungcola]